MIVPQAGADRITTRRLDAKSAAWLAAAGWVMFIVTLVTVSLDPPTSLDHQLQGDVAGAAPALLQHAPWLRTASALIARLGSAPVGVTVIAIVAIGYAARRRTLTPGFFLAGAYLGTIGTVAATKQLLHRPEPYDRLGDLGRSFPSGHSATAVVVWGGIALLVAFHGRGPAPRPAALSIAVAALVLVIAITLVARSAHWISDIIAGLAVGAAWLGTVGAVALHRGQGRGQPRRPLNTVVPDS